MFSDRFDWPQLFTACMAVLFAGLSISAAVVTPLA